MKKKATLLIFSLIISLSATGQSSDSVKTRTPQKHHSKGSTTLLVYMRVISDASGTLRIDQNIVPNFKVNKLLRMELGYRHGERSDNIGAYDHYKIELQTKSFFNHTRFVARMSDNIVRYGTPNYSRTNYLFIAETKIPVSKKWEAFANFGYTFTFQKNNVYEVTPEFSGSQDMHGIYKFGMKYILAKGFVEGLVGSYDVFNPYQLNQPFAQISFDYELWEHGTLYSYYRYQYANSFGTPYNDFLGLGVKIKLGRD